MHRAVSCLKTALQSLSVLLLAFALSHLSLPTESACSGLAFAAPVKTAPADVWQAVLSDHDNAPSRLIAVDKTAQQLFFFERQSPMRLAAEFPCTTGQSAGDKFVNGDLKTPEGIYFVVRHITSGLNYTLYGNEAYPLNYPNPVDRLRKKTGYGIWIHGKGVPLAPRDTQGCVGMNNGDIASLGEKINIGQPVTLAAHIEQLPMPGDKSAVIAKLESNVQAWAKAWSSRSATMFNFYDAEAYSLAHGQPFKHFRAQKESLFKRLAWIDTKVSDIQILEGPGYWVTWFNQDYKAPNLSTSGTRRLYWQQNQSGELRIVGMEWIPGLKSPTLLASKEKTPVNLPPTNLPERAAQANEAKANESKNTTLAMGTPSGDNTADMGTLPVDNTTLAMGTPPVDNTADMGTPPVDNVEGNNADKVPANSVKPVKFTSFDAMQLVGEWRSAWMNGNLEAYAAFYAPNATQAGKARNEFIEQKRRIWGKAKPALVEFENVKVRETENGLTVEMLQTYKDASGYADYGVKSLRLESSGDAAEPRLLITREDWVLLNK